MKLKTKIGWLKEDNKQHVVDRNVFFSLQISFICVLLKVLPEICIDLKTDEIKIKHHCKDYLESVSVFVTENRISLILSNVKYCCTL